MSFTRRGGTSWDCVPGRKNFGGRDATLEQKRKNALATLHHHRDRLMTEHDEGPEGGVLQLRPRIEHRIKVGAFC
jgi:hypothetical protein